MHHVQGDDQPFKADISLVLGDTIASYERIFEHYSSAIAPHNQIVTEDSWESKNKKRRHKTAVECHEEDPSAPLDKLSPSVIVRVEQRDAHTRRYEHINMMRG